MKVWLLTALETFYNYRYTKIRITRCIVSVRLLYVVMQKAFIILCQHLLVWNWAICMWHQIWNCCLAFSDKLLWEWFRVMKYPGSVNFFGTRVPGTRLTSLMLYCILKLCTVISTLRWAVLTVLWIGFCLTGPISLCLDSFVLCVCILCFFHTTYMSY